MSEPSEFRLVRCPKCENLLPEVKDYPVYQCGGCGAILGATNVKLEWDTLSQKSGAGVQRCSGKFPEKLDNCSHPGKETSQGDGSQNSVKSNGSYSRRADKTVLLGNTTDNQRNGPSTNFDKWGVGVVDNDLVENLNLYESSRVKTGNEFEEFEPTNVISNGSRKSGRVVESRREEGGEIEGFRRNPARDFHGVRYSNPMYPEDGPSNNNLMSSYGYGGVKNNQNKSDGFNKAEFLEHDGAELLMKLDELKAQLSRSCDVKEKPKAKFPLDWRWIHHEESYGGFESQFPDGSWGSSRGPHYVRHYPKTSPIKIRQEIEMHSFYPSMHAPNHVQGFGDPLRSQVLRRGPLQAPTALQQQSSHPYFSEQYTYADMNPFEPYSQNMNLHHHSCSCFHCYGQEQVPAPVPHAAFHNRMFPNAQNNLAFYHRENPSAFGPRDHNPKIENPPQLNSNNLQSHTRWLSDLNTESGDFVHLRAPRAVLATFGRHCHPIAGGAPFITCYNCFELLHLPKKMLLIERNQRKVLCGGCSTVIIFTVVDKKLVSVHAKTEGTPNIVGDCPITTSIGGTSHSHIHVNQAGANFFSGDYDDSVYEFQSMDREVVSSANRFKSGEMGSVHSRSPYSSEDEGNIANMNAQVEKSNSVEPGEESNLSPPAAGSPLQDHFDYSNQYRVVNRFGMASQCGHSEREKVEDPNRVTSRQNSMKDVSLATEMEVSFNEYSNTGTSQGSGDTSREEQVRVNKGGQSFFAGIIKKNFKDSSKSNQSIEKSSRNVSVNGHLMSDRLLKKAEKLSGPIRLGQYWYDSRAGFWGVMGGPCLGIIPPFIEEFYYPMPENCAGGNTSVFVNGRELHEKDLNLLSSRGLPTTRDRTYIIDISGRVLDVDSGEELDSLGKLAPTIEKVRHGFGMKVPRVAA